MLQGAFLDTRREAKQVVEAVSLGSGSLSCLEWVAWSIGKGSICFGKALLGGLGRAWGLSLVFSLVFQWFSLVFPCFFIDFHVVLSDFFKRTTVWGWFLKRHANHVTV